MNDRIILEELIRDYLLEEGLLRERLPDPHSKLDFGFVFSYPPGPKGQQMNSFKPKNKNYVVIAIRTKISKSQIGILNSSKNNIKTQFYNALRKLFLMKEVYFQIAIDNHIYEINDNIYLNKNGIISRNKFFKSARKVLYCYVYSKILLAEYCLGKEEISKKFDGDFNLPFYT
jgi:hypothetical protein